jgi:hypothetical protein
MSIDTSAAKDVIDAANTALEGVGCSIAPLTSPDHYPQGFLFARPEPVVGVTDDGNNAASYRGGLLITCDIPKSISEPSTFNPQRVQILLGFAYTGTALKPGDDNLAITGFDTGDLLGPVTPALTTAAPSSIEPVTATAAAPSSPPPASIPTEQAAPLPVSSPGLITPRHLAPSTKWLLGLVSLVLWVPLTHLGARRLRHALFDGAET